jgi:hypothetical protein
MALFTDTTAPTGGVPSLTASQITDIYNYYLHRPPTSEELASEMENALKYSAAGIERSIALRAGNVAGSGIRGDEGLPALTQPPPPPVVSQVTGALDAPDASVPPTGLYGTTNASLPINYATNQVGRQFGYGSYQTGGGLAPTTQASAAGGGFSMVTLLILAAVGVAAYFLVVK